MKNQSKTSYRSLTSSMAALFSICMCANSLAQDLPQTDIWLADINQGTTGNPVKINPTTGYNNQPHFSVDGSIIYFTREMPDSQKGAQTDIAAYSIGDGQTRMVNSGDQSEYSPTPIPGKNALSVIEVEPDQKQRLWSIDIDNGDTTLLLPGVEPVGYHAWINDSSVAMFILGEPFTLQTAEIGVGNATIVAENIGRTIRRHPLTGEILYVDKTSEPWEIAALNVDTGFKRMIMPLFHQGEDFTIDGNGTYWTGKGNKLYSRLPGDEDWTLVADFSMSGIGNITRLATDPASSKIAIVSDHEGN
jgi:hypothetical protein